MDSAGRVMALSSLSKEEAIFALWDFAAAFPSIFHDWILGVFGAYGFPEGYCSFLEGLFFHNVAYSSSKGVSIFLYVIIVGIIQGCPASGQIFAVSSNPIFAMLQETQDLINAPGPLGAVVRGCADDIGAALASFKLLSLFKPAFDCALDFAGLRLNDVKCTLVPLNFANFDGVSKAIREWL